MTINIEEISKSLNKLGHNVKPKHNKLDYGTNLLDMIGMKMLGNIRKEETIVDTEQINNSIDNAHYYIDYSPKEDYNFRAEINPGGFGNPDYKISGSIPIDIEGM
tara:strand:+ start:355 stop:669 length:315 start_codon:yes stop_codon:yes gene_type:complete